VAVLACVAVGGGLFVLGRESADGHGARSGARADGLREGRAIGVREGRAIGAREGRAAGLAEGRALQATASAPHGTRAAFKAGYAAGANDVFGGFDGGWSLGTPYVITLRKGSGAITYRIDSRRPARGTSKP
jgi:hypothetical protein